MGSVTQYWFPLIAGGVPTFVQVTTGLRLVVCSRICGAQVAGQQMTTLLPTCVMVSAGAGSYTVTVKVQVLVLPLSSLAEQVTGVAPMGKKVPDTGTQTT